MADEVTTTEFVVGGNGDDVTVETETRPEDAPWGYKADGKPYQRDPAIYRRRDGKAAPKGPKARTSKPPKGSKYRDTVLGFAQIAGLPLAAAATQNDVFMADLIALEVTAPGIADAFDQAAQTTPALAKALDKLAEVGPYGLIIGALAPLIVQGLCNHGVIPAGVMGTIPPADLIAQYTTQPEDAAA